MESNHAPAAYEAAALTAELESRTGGATRTMCYHCVRNRAMQTTKAGIREFRENLADYLESKTPVAITRHGATIGIYVPTKPKPSQADLEALRVAGEKMQELIAAAGDTEDEIVADFKNRRRRARKS